MLTWLKNKKWVVVAIVFVILGISSYFHIHYKKKSPLPTVVANLGSITEYAEAVGYIRPRHSSTVKSQIDGTVDEIYHNEGEFVAKDAPLLKVKPAPDPSVYATTFQNLEDAKVKEQSAALDYNRYLKALKRKLISTNYGDYIAAKKNYESARSSRVLAEQKLALLDIGKTKVGGKTIANIVVSPVDGYILYRKVDVGDPVISLSATQSSTILFTIADMKDLMFEGLVDEIDAAKMKVGMRAVITVGSIPDQEIAGDVSLISLQSDQENISQGVTTTGTNSGTSPFNVGFKVQISNLVIPKNLVLRSGYSATAKIKVRSVENVLVLPMRLIQFENGRAYVLVPTKTGEESKKRTVILGLTDGINAEIKSGLKQGEKVVDEAGAVSTKEDRKPKPIRPRR